MRKIRSQAILLALVLAGVCSACITAPRSAPRHAAPHWRVRGKPVVLDDFEAETAKNGASWEASADVNQLGSAADFKLQSALAGAEGSAGHFTGRLGRNVAPWPWARLALPIRPDRAPADLTGVRAVRFRAKGDGKRYRVRLQKDSVRDSAHFGAEFIALPGWRGYEFPLASLTQAEWGGQLPHVFDDVKSLEFSPVIGGTDYDLYIDKVEFVMAARGRSPFELKQAAESELVGASYLLDDFSASLAHNGAQWGFNMDVNNLGTSAYFKNQLTGDAARGNAAQFWGKLGKGENPLPWATFGVALHPELKPVDISALKGVRFWCKGDGKVYRFVISRRSVTDYGNFGYAFVAPLNWTRITIPLERLEQPNWATPVTGDFTDATAFQFSPQAQNADFDLWVDDVEVIYDATKGQPFSRKAN